MLREASGPTLQLNMTPMIDVVFLLLIYFVLVADFARPASIAGLDVVQRETMGDDPFALPEVPSVLSISSVSDGREAFAIDTDQPAFAGSIPFAESVARAFTALGAQHPVIVRPSSQTRWEHAVVVYRTLRDAGFERVELTEE